MGSRSAKSKTETRREGNNKVLKESNFQPKIIYSAKLFFKMKAEM